MPEADVTIHSGDISDNGTEEEMLDFLNWFIGLPYSHKKSRNYILQMTDYSFQKLSYFFLR